MKKLLLFCLLLIPTSFHANVLDDLQNEISTLTNKVPFLKSAINAAENEYNTLSGKINGIVDYFNEFGDKIDVVIHAVEKTIQKIKDHFIPAIESDVESLSKTSVEVNKNTVFVPTQFINQIMQPIDKIENMILNISNSGLSVSNSTIAAGDLIHHFGKALEFIGIHKAESKTKDIQQTINDIHATIVDIIAKEHEGIQATAEIKKEIKFIAQRLAQTLTKFKDAGVFDLKKIKKQVAAIIKQSGVNQSNYPKSFTPNFGSEFKTAFTPPALLTIS